MPKHKDQFFSIPLKSFLFIVFGVPCLVKTHSLFNFCLGGNTPLYTDCTQSPPILLPLSAHKVPGTELALGDMLTNIRLMLYIGMPH